MKSFASALSAVFWIFLSASNVWALPEDGLATTFDSVAIPYFETGHPGSFVTPDQVRIRYRIFSANVSPAKGKLLISSGRTEFMSKYAELIYDLRETGYEIFIYDHRGQGESDRLLPDPLKGHVGRFQDYVNDFARMIRAVVRPQPGEKLFVLAHSMGGAIATRFALQNPGVVTAMSLSAPMYQANIGDYHPLVALTMLNAFIAAGKGDDYARGRGAGDWDETFENNEVTSSRARFAYARSEIEHDFNLALAGPTNRWVREAIVQSYWLRTWIGLLRTPTLLMQAEKDVVVMPKAQTAFCAKTKRCHLLTMKDSKHEILMERDSIRDGALASTLSFFAKDGVD